MSDLPLTTTKNDAPLATADAIVIISLEELRVAMTETIEYAAFAGCDVERVRESIKYMADMIDIEDQEE